MNPVSPVASVGKPAGIAPADVQTNEIGNTKSKPGKSVFEGMLTSANNDQQNSDKAIKDLVQGNTDSVQEVVLAVAKAEMSFQLFMEIRNKLIESYNELMRMQF